MNINKGRRQELQKLKYIKRIKKVAFSVDKMITGQGEVIHKPTTVDLIEKTDPKINFNCYRTTSTPCSCSTCAPDKYKRSKIKKETHEKIREVYDIDPAE